MVSDTEFNEAYEKFSRPVYFNILRIVNNDAVAEEILQETFFRFLQKADAARLTEHRAFLFKISHNLAVDHIRKTARVRNTENLNNQADTRDYTGESDARMLRQNIVNGLAEKDQRYLRIFLLRVDFDMTYEEISQTLKIPKRTMMRYVDGLKKILREYL